MNLYAFIFAFTRIAGFVFFLPLFNQKNIVNHAKVVIAVALAIAVVDKVEVKDEYSVVGLAGMMIVQFVIGFTLAKMVEFLLNIPRIAGSYMDMDMGFSQAQLMDSSGQSNTIIATLLNLAFLTMFLILGGYTQLFQGIVRSFELTGTSLMFLFEGKFLEYALSVFMFALSTGIQIALPVMGAMFVLNVSIMAIGKLTPQMQIFQNMFAIKITVGLIFIATSLYILSNVFDVLTQNIVNEYAKMFEYLFTKGSGE